MLKEPIKIVVGAVALLVIYTLVIRFFTPDFLVEKVEVEVYVTTEIDSSQVYKEYLERIPQDEIDIVSSGDLEVPEPTNQLSISDSIGIEKHYALNYSDSSLASTTNVYVYENAITSWNYEYYLKQRIVRDQETTINRTITINRTETTTMVRAPKPYFTLGAEFTNLNSLSVGAGYMTSGRYHFYYRYNLDLESHSVGISIPLKFNIKSFL